MNESPYLPEASFVVISQMVPASEALEKTYTISHCCGAKDLRHGLLAAEHWKKFGMVISMTSTPLQRIENLAANREYLVIPDKDASMVLDWAVADRNLHDL